MFGGSELRGCSAHGADALRLSLAVSRKSEAKWPSVTQDSIHHATHPKSGLGGESRGR